MNHLRSIVFILPTVIAFNISASECPVRNPTQSATVFTDLDCFIECAGGSPFIACTFDDIPSGVDITNLTLNNITFTPNHAPLIIARDSQTFTPANFPGVSDPANFHFRATSGSNILSPGGVKLGPGPDPKLEDDDITLSFNPPVAAVGFDHLSQLADGYSYTHISVISQNGALLFEGVISISWLGDDLDHLDQRPFGKSSFQSPSTGCSDFWGIVSEHCDIAQIIIDEQDSDAENPDCNIAIDSLRVFPSPAQLPDLDNNARIDVRDLIELFTNWGSYSSIETGIVHWKSADFDRNSEVDANDLIALLMNIRLFSD